MGIFIIRNNCNINIHIHSSKVKTKNKINSDKWQESFLLRYLLQTISNENIHDKKMGVTDLPEFYFFFCIVFLFTHVKIFINQTTHNIVPILASSHLNFQNLGFSFLIMLLLYQLIQDMLSIEFPASIPFFILMFLKFYF